MIFPRHQAKILVLSPQFPALLQVTGISLKGVCTLPVWSTSFCNCCTKDTPPQHLALVASKCLHSQVQWGCSKQSGYSNLSTEAAVRNAISESFHERGQFAYPKSRSLRVKLLIQHTCGSQRSLQTTSMVIHWPANGYQSPPGTSCSHVKSPWFCCHHPGNASLDHLVNRTCIHRYNSTVANILLNQISLQGSVRREQTEIAIFQPFPQRDLLAYFKSCCLRVWPPGWTART